MPRLQPSIHQQYFQGIYSEKQLSVLGGPSLNFPINFPNGSRVDLVQLHCRSCSELLDHSCMSGFIDFPSSDLAHIHAASWCPSCNASSLFELKIRNDLSVYALMNGAWRLLQSPTKKRWIDRLFAHLKHSA